MLLNMLLFLNIVSDAARFRIRLQWQVKGRGWFPMFFVCWRIAEIDQTCTLDSLFVTEVFKTIQESIPTPLKQRLLLQN